MTTLSPDGNVPLPHQSRRRPQRWTTPSHVARYFGVRPETVTNWIRRDRLRASFVPLHHSDDRPRDTKRRRYRIYESDLMAMIRRMRARGKPGFGKGFWQGAR